MSLGSDFMREMLNSPSFKLELERIQEWATNELYQAVVDTVYSRPEGTEYHRTYDLLASIIPTDLVVTPTSIEFKVIFDESVMHHFSLYGSEKYGIGAGEPIGGLIVPFLDKGWDYSDRYPQMPHALSYREGAGFLKQTINNIQAQVVDKVKGALGVEVKKIGGRYNK